MAENKGNLLHALEADPIFHLDGEQKALLRAKMIDSLRAFCEATGLTPDEQLRLFYDNYVSQARELINGLKLNDFTQDAALSLKKALEKCSDYWDLLEIKTWEKRRTYVADLIAASDVLPINYPYLKKLSREMGLPEVDPGNILSLARLLLEIPVLYLFDLEFNAFVSGKTLLKNIPCIGIYSQLTDSLEIGVNFLLGKMFLPSDDDRRFESVRPELAHEISRRQDFIATFSSVVSMVLGESIAIRGEPQYFFTKVYPARVLEVGQAMFGATFFVNFHEFGHLLMGHIERSHEIQLEHDADSFATTVLIRACSNDRLLYWRMIGVGVLFCFMEIIEEIRGPSSVHPSALARLKHIYSIFRQNAMLAYYDLAWQFCEAPLRCYVEERKDLE